MAIGFGKSTVTSSGGSMDDRRAALLLPELELGGAQRSILRLAGFLVREGKQVDLILLRKAGPLLDEVPAGVCVRVLLPGTSRMNPLLLAVQSIAALRRYLREHRPPVLLSTISGANLVAVLAVLLARVPLRLVLREAISLRSPQSERRRWLMRLLYRKADVLVALSAPMRDELVSLLHLCPSRIAVVPNPIDVAGIRRAAAENLEQRWVDRLKGRRVFITVGRLTPQKDHLTLLAAFAQIQAAADCLLVIVGDGPCRAAIEQRIRELRIGESVLLIGTDRNPWRWMCQASVFVLASRHEGCPNVVVEARALGLPVVLTAFDASATALASPSGRVVPVGDASALAAAMRLALADAAAGPVRADAQREWPGFETYLPVLFPESDPHRS